MLFLVSLVFLHLMLGFHCIQPLPCTLQVHLMTSADAKSASTTSTPISMQKWGSLGQKRGTIEERLACMEDGHQRYGSHISQSFDTLHFLVTGWIAKTRQLDKDNKDFGKDCFKMRPRYKISSGSFMIVIIRIIKMKLGLTG